MLDITNDVICQSYQSVKRRLSITSFVTKMMLVQNLSLFVDDLVYIIVDNASKLGYSDDAKFHDFLQLQ